MSYSDNCDCADCALIRTLRANDPKTCQCVECEDPCVASPTGKGFCQDCWTMPEPYSETRHGKCHDTHPRDWTCRFCGASQSTPHWIRCPAWGATIEEVNHAR